MFYLSNYINNKHFIWILPLRHTESSKLCELFFLHGDVEHTTNQAPDISPGSAGPSPMNSPNDEKPVACAVTISDSSQTR